MKKSGLPCEKVARPKRLFSVGQAKQISPKANFTGFTLIELLVSISIFIIITGVVVMNQSSFGGNILISNLAYDVALSVRQAQVYGISAKGASIACPSPNRPPSPFNCSYGVHFASSGYYILFVDLDGNGHYDTNADNGSNCVMNSNPECVSFFKIERGNSIKKFCAGADCWVSGTNNTINMLDVVFHRPNPEPAITGYNGISSFPSNIASITVASPQGRTKTVEVTFIGQIAIK